MAAAMQDSEMGMTTLLTTTITEFWLVHMPLSCQLLPSPDVDFSSDPEVFNLSQMEVYTILEVAGLRQSVRSYNPTGTTAIN